MSFFEKAKKIAVWLVVGVISAFISHYIIELLFLNLNFESLHEIIFNTRTELFSLGVGVLFVLYSFISLVVGSSLVGGVVTLLASTMLGITTKLKSDFRGEPFFPNELYMIKETPFLMEMIGRRKSLLILIMFVLVIFIIVSYFKLRRKKQFNFSISRNYYFRSIGTVLSLLLLIQVVRFNYPNNKVKEVYNEHAKWILYDQNTNHTRNGFLAGFLSNMPAPSMNLPEYYSKENITDIVEKYRKAAVKINSMRSNEHLKSNVIFVMNESFSDPLILEGIESNKDPLKYYREILSESISGDNKAPSYGGGTASSEFQALTGFSLEPFEAHITSPYIQLVSEINRYPAMTKRAKRENYTTTAIHPYDPSFYRRNDIYEKMEFDQFLHQDNMRNREKISKKHGYISDFSSYQEVFDVMKQSDEKDFIHLVTMQNHTTYAKKYDSVNYEVLGSGNIAEANAYFQDLENSDLSLELLINKIDDFPEPIILMFWGDHLPGFYDTDILKQGPTLARYRTPFLIYSNEKSLNQKVDIISPIYFINYVLDVLDLKVTPYEALLLELEEKLPVLDVGVYFDMESKKYVSNREELSPDTLSILEDYTSIMYDIVSGNNYGEGLGFFE